MEALLRLHPKNKSEMFGRHMADIDVCHGCRIYIDSVHHISLWVFASELDLRLFTISVAYLAPFPLLNSAGSAARGSGGSDAAAATNSAAPRGRFALTSRRLAHINLNRKRYYVQNFMKM